MLNVEQIDVCGRRRALLPSELGPAYQNQIIEAKTKDVVKLCAQQVIPAEMQAWYQSLPSTRGTSLSRAHVVQVSPEHTWYKSLPSRRGTSLSRAHVVQVSPEHTWYKSLPSTRGTSLSRAHVVQVSPEHTWYKSLPITRGTSLSRAHVVQVSPEHTWYKSLPSTRRTKDHLPEPAVETSGNDDGDDDSV